MNTVNFRYEAFAIAGIDTCRDFSALTPAAKKEWRTAHKNNDTDKAFALVSTEVTDSIVLLITKAAAAEAKLGAKVTVPNA